MYRLHPTLSKQAFEEKLHRMGFQEVRHFRHPQTNTLIQLKQNPKETLIEIKESAYEHEEVLDYFYLRSIFVKK